MFPKCPHFVILSVIFLLLQGADNVEPFKEISILDVSLSNSYLPNEGVVQIITDNGTKSVCGQSLTNNAGKIVCIHLGYVKVRSLGTKTTPSGTKDALFWGKIDCNGREKHLSQCSITTSSESCSELSYIKCFICNRPLLEDKQRFPDSSFTALASSESHSPSDARIYSGSSWCAPVSDGKQYLQLDLGRLYVIYHFATFGDSTSPKWVTIYKLNYTVDLINWKPVWKKISGNKNAYNDARILYYRGGITTRALRFIPLTYVGQPCMRIEICGGTLLPDKPTNLAVTNIKSTSVEIYWVDPENTGDNKGSAVLSRFLIKLKKENSLILNITTNKVNERKLTNLTPNTTYEISVAARNQNGFGEEAITSFTTSEGGPSVLTNMSSGDIKAKEGDLVNLLCSAQGELPINFSWEKDQKSLDSIVEVEKPHRSSLLVVTVKDETSFGKYICHIRDRFESTTHTIWVQKLEDTGTDENDESEKYLVGIIVLAILLLLSFVIIAYFIYQIRRLKSSKANPANKSKYKNNSEDIDENPDINDDESYEQVENEQSTYTALKRLAKEENDDHLYTHLNEEQPDYA